MFPRHSALPLLSVYELFLGIGTAWLVFFFIFNLRILSILYIRNILFPLVKSRIIKLKTVDKNYRRPLALVNYRQKI